MSNRHPPLPKHEGPLGIRAALRHVATGTRCYFARSIELPTLYRSPASREKLKECATSVFARKKPDWIGDAVP
jgi:hypothetical protein